MQRLRREKPFNLYNASYGIVCFSRKRSHLNSDQRIYHLRETVAIFVYLNQRHSYCHCFLPSIYLYIFISIYIYIKKNVCLFVCLFAMHSAIVIVTAVKLCTRLPINHSEAHRGVKSAIGRGQGIGGNSSTPAKSVSSQRSLQIADSESGRRSSEHSSIYATVKRNSVCRRDKNCFVEG